MGENIKIVFDKKTHLLAIALMFTLLVITLYFSIKDNINGWSDRLAICVLLSMFIPFLKIERRKYSLLKNKPFKVKEPTNKQLWVENVLLILFDVILLCLVSILLLKEHCTQYLSASTIMWLSLLILAIGSILFLMYCINSKKKLENANK